MTINAEIIADSVSPDGIRLTTMKLRYPRIIHAEFMTHRVFSRNASSSRAVPISRVISDILDDPAEPVAWGSAQKGMQAGEPLIGWRLRATRAAWHSAKRAAILSARIADMAGAHKQVANRILEPWSHITVLVTATDWSNFFALRDHADADPTIQELAFKMREVMKYGSIPRHLGYDDWHLPYVSEKERGLHDFNTLLKMSAARCARVSYLTHENKVPSVDQDTTLFNRLAGSAPIHASPLEHQAKPDRWTPGYLHVGWAEPEMHGNLYGFIQHRKYIYGETADETNRVSAFAVPA